MEILTRNACNMKKFAVLAVALLPALSASAYYDDYGYSRHGEMSGFSIFMLVVMIAYIIISIVVLVRWWKMTENVQNIRESLTKENQTLIYQVALGEKEQAEKAALKMLVDLLYPIYTDSYNYSKAETMNKIIGRLLPKIQRLGLMFPDYVTSGEKFIDYLNQLKGCEVKYQEKAPQSVPDPLV